MPSWVWIIIVLVGVIAVYLISAGIIYFIMKKIQKKTFKALDDLVPFEKKRLEKILQCRDALEAANLFHPGKIADTIEDQQEIASRATIDMATLKGQNDFLTIYFQKLFKEKRLLKISPYKEMNEAISKDMYIDPSIKDSPYKKYDDLAFRYNSYLGMMIIAPFNRGNKNPRAPIL